LLNTIPKGYSLADQTQDNVYELAAAIIDSNPKYGVADAETAQIGQDELVGSKQVINIAGDNSTKAEESTIEKKI